MRAETGCDFIYRGKDFFNFQWDQLLLEQTFWATFAAILSGAGGTLASSLMLGIFRIMLFKVVWLSGLCKVASGCPKWNLLRSFASAGVTMRDEHSKVIVGLLSSTLLREANTENIPWTQ